MLAVEDLVPIGDEELDVRTVAEAMGAGLRPDDTIARVGPRSLLIVCNDVLPAGPGRLEVRPDGPLRGPLIDLRAVELRPVPDPCCE